MNYQTVCNVLNTMTYMYAKKNTWDACKQKYLDIVDAFTCARVANA